jgi:hypothetical protein
MPAIPTPVPPPGQPMQRAENPQGSEAATPRAATSKSSDDPDVIARAKEFIKASREKKAKAITDSARTILLTR